MNTPLRKLALLASAALFVVLPSASAQAHAAHDPLGFQFQSDQLTVHENAGGAVITVQRSVSESAAGAQVRYISLGTGVPCGPTMCTAISPYDFTSVKGQLNFAPGQTSMTFSLPIVDHGAASVPKTIQLSLFGPSPIGLASPSTAVLTILNDDPPFAHNAANPLGLSPAPTGGNPLAGARFFVDHESEATAASHQYPALSLIAGQPGTSRFGNFSLDSAVPTMGTAVSRYLTRAAVQEPGTVPMLATYRIVSGHCGHWSDSPGDQLAYHNFIDSFAQGIGSYRAVLFLEMDSLITTGCLSRHGVAVRMAELRDAISLLTANCPQLVIYLDAGAADALPAKRAASLLRQAGVASVQGFILNATHFDFTSREIRYGEQISRLTGGKHFIVNTGENGRGPLVPRDRVHQGNEVLCNPSGRGLGPKPTSNTGYPNVDAFAWTSNPGESGGKCVPGAPAVGAYWPAYALGLVANANFSARRHAGANRHP